MIEVKVSEEISSVCPVFAGAAIEAKVINSKYSEGLWKDIHALCEVYRQRFDTTTIKLLPGVEATRRVYRACGKDPSRYRPSSEALIRRVVQGKDLYQIDTLVDLINLASMKFGYSIGGFDADKFVGETLILGIGRKDEPYEGIGRGILNIEGMPVYRDAEGGVGTPTSDNERTKIDASTNHLLVIINGYDGNRDTVMQNADFVKELLQSYASGTEITITAF